MSIKIVVLPGDGIGPEVSTAAQLVLDTISSKFNLNIEMEEKLMGGISIDQHGVALTDETLADCIDAKAVLLGAVGGPKWDNPNAKIRPEQGLLTLRKEMGLFANLRPIKVHPQLHDASPLKNNLLNDVDILVVRELTGGIYFGKPSERIISQNGTLSAVDSMIYKDFEIKRIVELACKLSENRKSSVTSVDKANVLESSRLWRQIANNIFDVHPNIKSNHILVDAAAMHLISQPAKFDVIVTSNLFGDILTDEASVLTGSMGNLPSASIGKNGPGLYEPIHGSAPDIAGKGIANPIGMILSTALLLRYSLDQEQAAMSIEKAVNLALEDGCRTVDLNNQKSLSTQEMTNEIIMRLESINI
tara:strand:- start:8876 stop:9958 length:1083 start_codon:yes stop_codon:yes gene_type:complete